MMRFVPAAVITAALLLAGGDGAAAQPARQPRVAPVQVQVVISRYRDEKKISSRPYALSVPVDDPARLQVGGNVPVPGGEKGTVYRNVGTELIIRMRTTDDGRYELNVTVSETAVAGEGAQLLNVTPGVPPVLRTYTSTSALVLKDGQTAQFAAGTDPITGDVVRVDVTLTVPK
jgi:hypothetical protein